MLQPLTRFSQILLHIGETIAHGHDGELIVVRCTFVIEVGAQGSRRVAAHARPILVVRLLEVAERPAIANVASASVPQHDGLGTANQQLVKSVQRGHPPKLDARPDDKVNGTLRGASRSPAVAASTFGTIATYACALQNRGRTPNRARCNSGDADYAAVARVSHPDRRACKMSTLPRPPHVVVVQTGKDVDFRRAFGSGSTRCARVVSASANVGRGDAHLRAGVHDSTCHCRWLPVRHDCTLPRGDLTREEVCTALARALPRRH